MGRNEDTERLEDGRRVPAFFDTDGRRIVLNDLVVVVVERFRAVPLHQRRNVAHDGSTGRRRQIDA